MWKEEGVTQEFRELFFQSTISVSKNVSDNFFLERNTRLISPYQCVINCFILPGIYFDLSHAAPVYTNPALK